METDARIMLLMQAVKDQRKEILTIEKADKKTNQSFRYREENLNDAINIGVVSSIRDIIAMASFLVNMEKNYTEVTKILEIDAPPKLEWCGYSVEDWLSDLKMRVKKIQISTKRQKLTALEERLNKIISPELRAQMELEEIENELKG